MMYDRHADEWACLTCGHVDYGSTLTPEEALAETALVEGKTRRREPMHGKIRL